MASYNKVLLIGNLTRDPQLTYTPNQTPVVEFGLATNRKWTGQDGSQREETCFVDCRSFGRQAETINKYLSKGRPVFVEGRLTYDSWTAQDGSKRSRLRVTVENFQFLGGGGGQGGGAPAYGGAGQANAGPAGGAPPMQQNTGGGAPPAQENAGGGIPEDQIPF